MWDAVGQDASIPSRTTTTSGANTDIDSLGIAVIASNRRRCHKVRAAVLVLPWSDGRRAAAYVDIIR